MRFAIVIAIVLLVAGVLAFAFFRAPAPAPDVVVTIAPLAALMEPMLPEGATLKQITPPGASPHTYEPLPADARAAEGTKLLVYVADSLDGWAAGLNAQKQFKALDGVPDTMRIPYADEHGHEGADTIDPHFWLDPMTVMEVLPALAGALNESGVACVPEHVVQFAQDIFAMHNQIEVDLAPLRGKSVVVFHDSLRYLFNRYGIEVAGVIERSPGKEPSPKDIQDLTLAIKDKGAIAVVTEPQYPEAPAKALSESTGVPLIVIDPIGGVPGNTTYAELMQAIAKSLLSVVEK